MLEGFNRWFCCLVILLLAGCASSVDCNVVSFHSLEEPHGERVRLVHKDPAKTGGPEFKHYAAQIAPVLAKVGYRPLTSPDTDLVFEIGYGVGPGPEEITRLPRCSMRYHFRPHEPGGPLYYGMQCFDTGVEIREKFVHFLELKVRRAGEGQPVVYEGMVHGLDASANLSVMMPYLIAALFDEFPGVSGEVRSVTIDRSARPDK